MAEAGRRLTLDHGAGATRIEIGAGTLAAPPPEVGAWLRGRGLFVLSTPTVRRLHGTALDRLTAAAERLVALEVEDGEGAKSLVHAGRLWQEMLAAGGRRDSRLVTFGGGTVGDLGGFVAGCFLRGVEYLQVPTTLLAQVDAALGGKTGVDLPGGKNTVGLFHHPRWVLADTGLLSTLPRAELRAGLVEVVKMAYLLDPGLLEAVEAGLERLLAADPAALTPVVERAAAAKVAVVEGDPREADRRRLLNFGHTLGHALEGALGYRGLTHGEAVGYGLLFALRLAERRGLDRRPADRLRRLLARLELPPLPPLAPEALYNFIERDKKHAGRGVVWVLPRAIGRGEAVEGIGRREVLAELGAFLSDPHGAAPTAGGGDGGV